MILATGINYVNGKFFLVANVSVFFRPFLYDAVEQRKCRALGGREKSVEKRSTSLPSLFGSQSEADKSNEINYKVAILMRHFVSFLRGEL
jgi:hypothetical protein